MVDKIDDKKIRKISGTQMTPEVKKTEAVGQVGRVKGVSSVKGAGGPSGIRRQGTRMMTLEEREELFRLVAEEAEKLFPESTLPKERRTVIADAVKMAIDSGLLEKEDKKDEK